MALWKRWNTSLLWSFNYIYIINVVLDYKIIYIKLITPFILLLLLPVYHILQSAPFFMLKIARFSLLYFFLLGISPILVHCRLMGLSHSKKKWCVIFCWEATRNWSLQAQTSLFTNTYYCPLLHTTLVLTAWHRQLRLWGQWLFKCTASQCKTPVKIQRLLQQLKRYFCIV
jgi:hypothetical protein